MLARLSEFLFGKAGTETHVEEAPSLPRQSLFLTDFPSPLKPDPQPEPELLTRNWSHPFGDRSDPLQQLTHLAKAADGYYPIGVHGSWHGGVHFDDGTAGALDQSRVLCLADGEIVAYRIPTQTPTTRYFPIPETPLDTPSASGFVLVRHRIQAPAIEGCDETPPALTFYSLYMHLQDWAAYEDRKLERPAFWVESEAKWVKEGKDAPDINRKNQRGVWVAHRMTEWRILDFLPAGTQVEISGNGHYRELKGTLGPSSLLDENGALQGYVAAAYLGQRAGEMLEITRTLNVRAEPHAGGAVLGQLPARTLVEISGSGDFVKLERIEQYVPITALRSEYIPALRDQVFVPEKPIPIKAGELIGHIGPYQHAKDSQPRHKLHLEVFCTDYLPKFLDASRAWAERLPAKERTWLKIAKGSLAIIRKPEHGRRFPAFVEPHHVVDADLLVPKSLIDNLPAASKIHQPEPGGGKKRNWYYLEGLLNDEQGNIVDGWVAEIIGETPWVSPWHWDGYEVIHNSPSQTLGMAYRLSLDKKTSEEDLARLKPSADQWEQGELQSRLYAIIDRNRDRKLSTEEIRTALSIPAHAQALSRIVLECESEWYYRQEKWDALDQIFGHTTSAPILNWVAEKERIKALSWWGDVVEALKFPKSSIYFLHPIGLLGHIQDGCSCGCCMGPKFRSVRYRGTYGPVLRGKLKLKDFPGLDNLVAGGVLTKSERRILTAMSENEGNMDALQSYDSEILTAGAMQKTINFQGGGELPAQVDKFKEKHPLLYKALFEDCGWTVKAVNNESFMYYKGRTGDELKRILRDGFDKKASEARTQIASAPLAAFANAIKHEEYLALQVVDFIERLRKANNLYPRGFSEQKISDFLYSDLGKALILDQHVNRPNYVGRDFGKALDLFFDKNPGVSRNPMGWGVDRIQYESKIIEIYGPLRDMTHPVERYEKLKGKL
ncbi:SH3 domain-containing protein [Pseudomonas japonica]|uniref:SH3 domain-containing protein n=1 Tax=Pseudomonas japonica TaxID=256466 RepID=UPI00380655D1